MKTKVCCIAIMLCVTTMLPAQSAEDFTRHSGYVDFGSFDKFKDAEETVEVFIQGPLLKFVSRATAKEDPELSKLLDDLVLVKVNVFSVAGKEEKEIQSMIRNISGKLKSKKWETMVRVKEPGEKVEIFTQFDKNGNMTGLVVMAMESGDEAVFVNIAGKIDPDKIARLGGKFNIPKLDSLDIKQ